MVSALLSAVTWTGNRLEAKTENQAGFSPWNEYQKDVNYANRKAALNCSLLPHFFPACWKPACLMLPPCPRVPCLCQWQWHLYKIEIWVSRRQKRRPTASPSCLKAPPMPHLLPAQLLSSGKSSKRDLCFHLIHKNKLSVVIQRKRWWHLVW